MGLVLKIAALKLIFHCIFNNRYDYFRDEFDYLACGDHLAWGYVDHPPLVPFIVHVTRLILGDGLRAIRFPAALAASAVVVLTGLIAREMGGRRFAVMLAALGVAAAPIYLSDGSLLTTNAFEPVLWMGCVYCAMLAVNRNDARYWLWFGVVAGIGLEEKYSMGVFGAGMAVGLLATRQRRFLTSRWIWMGAGAALLIFLPNLVWNVENHWPFAELMRNIRSDGRDVQLPFVAFLAQQALLVHPLLAPLWIAGLAALLCSRRFAGFRMLGWCYLAVFAFFEVTKGKNYYLAPIYPMLLAAGAVVLESGIARTRRAWLKPAVVTVVLASAACLAPIVVPVLPVDGYLAYQKKLPFAVPRMERRHLGSDLPQHYADQFGWREMTAAVAAIRQEIPAGERPACGIFANDYGEAGALDFFGRGYGLPPALSGHQSYFLWGPRGYTGNCMIVLNSSRERLEGLFDQVEYRGKSANPYALEQHWIFLCRGAKFGSLAAVWPALKKWR